MANETILVVDRDKKIQKILDVNLRKAGYRVFICESPIDAFAIIKNEDPHLIISETNFEESDGFEFLADLKSGKYRHIPFIFLSEDRALPQKMKGFELGADDYLTKPFYLKEITTRADLLIQRHTDTDINDLDANEFSGRLANISLVDLLQKIEADKTSGSIQLEREEHNASIYFREGNFFDAFYGKLRAEEAIYRLFFWPDGEFIVRYHDIGKRKDRVPKTASELLIEGMERLSGYQEEVENFNTDAVYDVVYEKMGSIQEHGKLLRLFDGERSVREVIDHASLDDLTAIRSVKKMIAQKFVVPVYPHGPNRVENIPSENTFSSLAEETHRGIQPLTPDEEVRTKRKTERLLETQERRTKDQQHAIKTNEVDSTPIEEIERKESERRAIEAERLSGQYEAIKSDKVADLDSKRQNSKRKRRHTPVRSQAHVSVIELENELSEFDEDEASTAEIPNAAEAYASMQDAHLANFVSEADTFEDSDVELDEEMVSRTTPFFSKSVATRENIEPLVRRHAVDGELVSKTYIIGNTADGKTTENLEELEPSKIDKIKSEKTTETKSEKSEKIIEDASKELELTHKKEEEAKEKKKDEEEENHPQHVHEFFNSEPPEEEYGQEHQHFNVWIPVAIGVLFLFGLIFFWPASKVDEKKAVSQSSVAEKVEIKAPENEKVAIIEEKMPEEKSASILNAEKTAGDYAIDIEANSSAFALHLNENQDEIEKVAEISNDETMKAIEADIKAKALKAEAKLKKEEKAKLAKTKKEENLVQLKEKETKETKEEVKASTNENDFKKRLKKAESLVKRRKWRKALTELRKLSKEKPGSGKCAYLHGRAAFESQSTSEAIKFFERAKRSGYKSAAMMLDLAAAYQLDGKRGKAKSAYESYLKIRPTGRQSDEVRSILKNQF